MKKSTRSCINVSSSAVLADVLALSEGKFVTVDFVKKDMTIRTLNGRIGVKKYIKGGAATTNTASYITIYDTVQKGYRSVNKETIMSIRFKGVEMKVVNE
jgi:hypothetical protein